MPDFLSLLHAPTMVLMVVVLYAALSLVLVYAYACRRTYPGFGAMTLGQVLWTVGIFLNFYRFLGEAPSLLLGSALTLSHGALLFLGLARYGRMPDVARRSAVNIGLYCVAMLLLGYYLLVDFNTCRRAFVYSLCCALVYGRIALEPFLVRRWRTYATQPVFSGIFGLVAVLFFLRAIVSWQAVDCPVTSPDVLVKQLLLLAMLCSPLLIFCILAMTSSRVEAELGEARDELRHLAETDVLTGLPNRRHFLRLAGEALGRAREQGLGVSLVMLDLDNFKTINDTHGHQAGDRVLRGVGRCLADALQAPGRVGRLGGEEFGVLLPGVTGPAAVAVAERLRRSLEALQPDGLAVTASFGVAEGAKDVDALLALADECLYAAKRAGRNRVEPQPAAVAAPGP
uniref:diguanylate cyclase n=1 Tax=Desulfovibrio sp. U5L TaxID=596152 RepID=I2Q490_9BACT